MRIIAVDDERRNLEMLLRAIEKAAPHAGVTGFQSAAAALEHARTHRVDVAFLDIMMPEMNGLILAKHLKDIYGRTNIVFVTGYAQYAPDAFGLRASGYLMKPVTPERIGAEIENLRNPIASQRAERVRVQCFGSFAVFANDKPLLFSRTKPKELLAYLVHKQGAAITNAEIASVLWEGQPATPSVQSNTRNVIAHLMHILQDADISEIVCKARNSMAIDTQKISCDYYDYLNGDAGAVNAYMGEYLSDYSWAEFTVAYLNHTGL